ncbi:GlxA family transcriptional regulator [Pseudomonas sp. ME-P-057]|uniref:GlxA family transcriptional regulator n=1 Tax=Pseudomonas sp. ME-P-057 TaxID=3040321 RepID=UPI002554BC23|nr:GlxA family transcriptional regulator [Pseudomonas sp. ME-P-057]
MRKISVGFVIFPGFQLLDIAGPKCAFEQAAIHSDGELIYELHTIGILPGPIKSSSGLTVIPDMTIFDNSTAFDTLVVSGGQGIFDVVGQPDLQSWLQTQAGSCRRISAICNGVFALGKAGLIDDRNVTTHWKDASKLREMFPSTRVLGDCIYLKDDAIYTTAGITAGIDLALFLIEEDFGKALASEIARYLIVYLRRTGEQPQLSHLLRMQSHSNSSVEDIQSHVLASLASIHTMESLAKRVHMSVRNLSRLFMKSAGVPPMTFIANARIESACRLLETTDLSLKEIAYRCGFGNVDGFRRAFLKRLGVTPILYRQGFRAPHQDVLGEEE